MIMQRFTFARRALAFPRAFTQPQCIRQLTSEATAQTTITPNIPSAAPAAPASTSGWTISRTPYAQLPIYKRWRGGGTQEQILIKKVEGNRKAFISDLLDVTGIDPEKVRLNPTTRHIEVTGAHFEKIKTWLQGAGF